ncbi:response regulator transcription factor [Amycolatopsis anabasis]|uniref:response regulator transcription factor n=1 Tax=Amycolatopsis anabasis TaxID=1840409 RepID=UPI00131DAB36|nr:LuxR C-terminal-related transcriptional regulator [Amycolatopsis anabasis]
MPLSKRHDDVLQLILREKTNQQIARELGIAEETVRTHVKAILERTRVLSRVGLVVWAYETGRVVPGYVQRTTREGPGS